MSAAAAAEGRGMGVNFMQAMSVGMAIGSEVITSYESLEATGDLEIPPIKTYLGGDHLEIVISVKKLPPP